MNFNSHMCLIAVVHAFFCVCLLPCQLSFVVAVTGVSEVRLLGNSTHIVHTCNLSKCMYSHNLLLSLSAHERSEVLMNKKCTARRYIPFAWPQTKASRRTLHLIALAHACVHTLRLAPLVCMYIIYIHIP